jgi:hypothetical protein
MVTLESYSESARDVLFDSTLFPGTSMAYYCRQYTQAHHNPLVCSFAVPRSMRIQRFVVILASPRLGYSITWPYGFMMRHAGMVNSWIPCAEVVTICDIMGGSSTFSSLYSMALSKIVMQEPRI